MNDREGDSGGVCVFVYLGICVFVYLCICVFVYLCPGNVVCEDGEEDEREREDMTRDAGMERPETPFPKKKKWRRWFPPPSARTTQQSWRILKSPHL